jgi:hypothetical protein
MDHDFWDFTRTPAGLQKQQQAIEDCLEALRQEDQATEALAASLVVPTLILSR